MMIEDYKGYLDMFGMTVSRMEDLTSLGLRRGGSYCDLYFENSVYDNLLLRDGEVSSGGFHIDYGAGIRVLDSDRTGYAYSESTDPDEMVKAAQAAAMVAGGKTGCEKRINVTPVPPAGTFYPVKDDWTMEHASEYVRLMKNLEERIRQKDSRVAKVIVSLVWSKSDIMMFNSIGELTCDTRPLASLSVSTVFTQNGRIENSNVSLSHRAGSEMLTEEAVESIAARTVKGLDDKFEAVRPKGGRMSVVMAAGASGILLHEAMGHAFEADFNRKGQSIFSDKMGRRICSEKISIVDDGTIPGNRGAVNFDDEGVRGQKTWMVRDGVLTSFLHDRISAKHYGVAPTGNGRRESFRYEPLPRMRATYMESGDAAPGDIIASVKQGIYVEEFANGQVMIGEGDFTFYVKSGHLIENGRLTAPVKDVNIIGNGPEALKDIVAVGNDLKIDDGAWTCGKGQSCSVSQGIPTVLVNNLTAGGGE